MNYNYFKEKIVNLKVNTSIILYDNELNFGFGIKRILNGYIIGDIKLSKERYFDNCYFFFKNNTIEQCDNDNEEIEYILTKMFQSIFKHIMLFDWFIFKNKEDKDKFQQLIMDYRKYYTLVMEEMNDDEEKILNSKYNKIYEFMYLLFVDNLFDFKNIGFAEIKDE